MSIDTITLQCFLAVAETQSFTKAAQRVGRTQSAISQQIAKLENLIEKPLINRGRELSLTTDGEIFLGYAKRIYELHRESLDRFKAPELQGEIRFGLPEDFASIILSDVLVEFSRLHPRVLLNVECDLTLNLIERFNEGKFDLILIKTTQQQVGSESIYVCTEPVEWIGKKELLPLLDKPGPIPLVLSPTPCVYRGNVIDTLDKNHIDWRLVYSSASYAGKMAAVRAGLGITAIQRSMIPNYLERLDYDFLPILNDVHVSLLKKSGSNKAIESLEFFILQKLKY
ncbi:TPA: LysR family transcriptional regulator [Legionella pneumophila]|uniref:Transcriptional regulator, LysR family n=2 Tax=Legionella pneumophila TaxID=446 RepID=Q5ZYY8_LEGPH|nr:LysR substrate-binding domain-containing protein [Legionella pneumophila]AAU26330.1 transcriptional regulator, LysR family [Legionella pneumophila subsp. pneumophila str. Philadelphia 1]AEW50514.1 transcriptional regulator, LysR family [Legionella pneumophila subsp. pneumophila ATCC 43290]AGH55094.1 Transcriptional regulator, LysR family [Legionella pneumophila subsp. pneumophila LPE509]AGN13148.1 LysR family transcriptional regulator [Legionella pneumophila subsp. pneumophila str. Thunder B